MKKLIAIFVFCGILLTGCSQNQEASSQSIPASQSASSSQNTPSSASVISSQSSPVSSEVSSQGAAYSKEKLQKALSSCCSFETGTAGGSLKAAIAASNLVAFSAQYATDDALPNLGDDIQKWYDGLAAEKKKTLAANWPAIYGTAQKLVADPASVSGLLSDAGVSTDFSKLDLNRGISVSNCLDSLIGNVSPSSGSTSKTSDYSKEKLEKVLSSCCSFETGTAGGSLKAAIAASNLVAFSAQYATDDALPNLGDDIQKWYSGLAAEKKKTLAANWPAIYDTAQKLVADPASVSGLLSDAGVSTDFSKLDLKHGISVSSCLDSLINHS